MPHQQTMLLQNNFLYKSNTKSVVMNEADQLFQLGVALLKQGGFEKAKEILGKDVEINPKHFDAYHLLGTMAGQTSSKLFGSL
jgi:Tfp pilus assembly protein PilF